MNSGVRDIIRTILCKHGHDFRHYPHNPRTTGDFALEIRAGIILADHLGLHSAWMGEHHFERLGVNSRPELLLHNAFPDRGFKP